MRICFPTSRIPILRSRHHRASRISRPIVSRRSVGKQLSNAELLNFIHQETEDAASAQTSSDGLDSHRNDIPQLQESVLATRKSRLPQSPWTDPGLVAARTRHKAVKGLPSGDRSPFQLKLQKNPYAIALATPPRLCVLTGLRLPSYFHIPFGIATHPKTGTPWHLPRLPIQAPSYPVNDEIPNGQPGGLSLCPLDSDTPTTLKGPIRTLSGTHFLASRHVLAHVSALTPVQYKRLLPYRWKQDTSVKIPEIIWREDMNIFVLEILRRNVLKTLSYLTSRPAAYIAPCKSYESLNEHSQVAAVLWLRKLPDISLIDEPTTSDATSFDSRETGPPPHAMHYYKTRYIPYYNLPALLGPSRLSALQKTRPDHYGDHFAVIKLKRTTVRVQLELWKLLGYMAQDGNYG